MIQTKLILIEGLPGSGKSTTTEYLADEIKQHSINCQWFHELAENNPIKLGFETSSPGYRDHFVRQWTWFVEKMWAENIVTILESRFWQNILLTMYRSVYSKDEVVQFQRRVVAVIGRLQPVLIHFRHSDPKTSLQRLYEMRGEKWVNWIVNRDVQEPWFRSRGLSGFAGWVKGYESWLELAEELFADFPFPKLQIVDAHKNWQLSYQTIVEFLELKS